MSSLPAWELSFVFLSCAAAAVLLAVLMAQAVLRLRIAHGKKWVSVSLCVFSIAVSGLLSVPWHLASQQVAKSARWMSRFASSLPSPYPYPNATNEERTRHTRRDAAFVFEAAGRIVNYIDLDGTERRFEPSESDHRAREGFALRLEQAELRATLLLFAALGWYLVPLAGVALAFLPRSRRLLLRDSTRRSGAGPSAANGTPLR
jgi:hypothetical protein